MTVTRVAATEKDLTRREDLGVNLHTALRKCCDSRPTSLAYNLIALDAFNAPWINYLEVILQSEDPVTVPKLRAAVAEALPWGQSGEYNALRIAFEMFDDDDWAGFVAFEEEENSNR